ncbi:15-hydroxyprostaglandin dehydrogenase [NAD(+)] [Tolypocladium ophioglossoides CBS 100239]|uniref:15-hydroxyprostaglandin dehydrogenase [NAD(+)] n=1 Tax=Tolypocladium ophioglossoides (strain CBS 100239) TaxID=1163406 RepID=A0A0L0N5D7_TOLOC|nr:15-hydroxyprostaglandin dehydrogenase [NAD(+)] [Tolypocladium ophioglossoides CBS 100239]
METQTPTVPFSVFDKTAIVTGAGSGINLAFTALLLSHGCNVLLADICLRPEAQALISNHQDNTGTPRAVFIKTDVTSWTDLRRMFDTAVAEFGSFDIVCPGAGIYEPHWSNFWHPPGSKESRDGVESGGYKLLDVNLTHPIRTTQLALSYWLHPRQQQQQEVSATPLTMKASLANPKRVIHISSIAGQLPVFRTPLYGASKFAITGFVRCLAPLEPALGVRVNAVAPGLVRTPLWTEHPEKLVNVDQEKDGWVTPDEVADAMLACVEQEALVGGTVLEVGKGRTREVGVLHDPGPDMSPGTGFVSSRAEEGDRMVWEWLEDGNIWGVD